MVKASEALETEALRRPRARAVPGFRVEVVEGPDSGAQHLATGARLTVGTHESNELRVTDRSVSRFHCELVVASGQVVLRDLRSMNGTQVDGVPVLAAPLRDGATISLGRTTLRFALTEGAVEIPLSPRLSFELLVGCSPAMREVFALLERAAASDATVLLGGETGTGKEAAAESIHRASPRADGPFVVVDCSAIPRELMESELFGHEKGAFTGAVAAKVGAFEAASGGTLFLDEIGELPIDLQPKLLRALERKECKRIGATAHVRFDVRFVAATHRDLRTEVNERTFRADLYYRLAVVEARLPPLRERLEDLPVLVAHILQGLSIADPHQAAALRTDEFAAELERHAWPGNVRELRNHVERCLALRERVPLPGVAPAQADEPARPGARISYKIARERWLARFERDYLTSLVEANEGNIAKAAREAGMDRVHLYRLLWRHGLR